MPTPLADLRAFLEAVCQVARTGSACLAKGCVYDCPEDFVLQHGRSYQPSPLPAGVEQMPPKHCYANAICLAVLRPEFRYVEGYATLACVSPFPFMHAWVTDGERAIDPTWAMPGVAYLGVEFSVERADNATWHGDSNVLDDFKRGWPLLRERWAGEVVKEWEPSPILDGLRRMARGGRGALRRCQSG